MTNPFDDFDNSCMQAAMEEAKSAALRDEVPIGAILVNENRKIIARNSNRTIELSDPTAHAEMMVIREGCKIAGSQRIPDYTLYVTLEPCAMCAAAISFARIERIVFAAGDFKGGGIHHGGKFYDQPTCHHRPVVDSGLMAEETGDLLRAFFKGKR